MANKRVGSKSDPLVPTIVHLHQSTKDSLAELKNSTGKSVSALIREWAVAQIKNRAAEKSKLKEEIKQDEAALRIKYARLEEIEAETNKQQNAIVLREQLLDQQVDSLVNILKSKSVMGNVTKIESAISSRVKGMNEKLNGSGAQPFAVEDLRLAVIEKAKAQGVELYHD